MKHTQQNICLRCGRVIDNPGICSVCAEFTTEVYFPVLVSQVIPSDRVINPEDLKAQIIPNSSFIDEIEAMINPLDSSDARRNYERN